MTSVLRNLQAEWNSMVPAATARGIRRVRLLNAPLETIAYRKAKVEWLRAQLGTTASFESLTFGVEIECHRPRGVTMSAVAHAISQAGVPCQFESYNHTTRQSQWKVTTDGSLGYNTGCEIVSPVLRGEDGFRQLRKVCDILTSLRCTVNRQCGFHVHVGAGSETIEFFKNLIKLYASAETAIDQLVAPSRRASANGFCTSLASRVRPAQLDAAQTVDAVALAIGQTPGRSSVRDHTRYCKLNLKSFWQHGTVEFRQHQGTVESMKAENWVRLCLRMVLTARAGEKTVSSVEDLLTALDATETEKSYFNGRVVYFQTRQNRRVA